MDEFDWTAIADRQPVLATVPAPLRAAARLQQFAGGATVFRRGQKPAAVLCVLAGEVRLLRHNADGGNVVLQRCRSGFFAEASIDSGGYHCDAIAASDSELLRFPIAGFRAALNEDAEFNRNWIAHLARELRRLRAQCERLSLRSAAERVIHCIETEGAGGRLALTQSRKSWAAELGLSHEALYRVLARLAAEGRIAIDGNTLSLKRARA